MRYREAEVDLCTAPRLRRVLGDAAQSRGQVVCDLTGVEFLGAKGLDALTAADQAARAHGAQLWVVTGSRMVRRVLALTGLDRDLDTSWQLDDLGDLGDLVTPVPPVASPQPA